MNNYGQLRLLR